MALNTRLDLSGARQAERPSAGLAGAVEALVWE